MSIAHRPGEDARERSGLRVDEGGCRPLDEQSRRTRCEGRGQYRGAFRGERETSEARVCKGVETDSAKGVGGEFSPNGSRVIGEPRAPRGQLSWRPLGGQNGIESCARGDSGPHGAFWCQSCDRQRSARRDVDSRGGVEENAGRSDEDYVLSGRGERQTVDGRNARNVEAESGGD
jgi:hypothetical protein